MSQPKILSETTEFNDSDQSVTQEVIQEIKKSKKKTSKPPAELRLPKVKTTLSAKDTDATSIERIKSAAVELPKIVTDSEKFLDIFQLGNLDLLRLDDYKKFKETTHLANVSFLDLSGLERLTDFSIYRICELIKANPNVNKNMKFNKFKLNACRNISIWSLSYLAKSANSNLLDLFSLQDSVEGLPLKERVSSCELISKNMIASLEYSSDSHKDLKLADTAKIVIINEDSFIPCIADRLVKTASRTKNRFFTYAKLNYSNKFLNLYDCSENFSHLVLTERNLVVLTFQIEKADTASYERVNKSLMSRLLKLASKNILPISVMILGLGGKQLNEQVMKKVAENLHAGIQSVQNDLKASLDIQME